MQHMRDLLRSCLRESLGALGALDRLSMAWPVAVGHTIAERTCVTQLTRGVATVLVDGDAAWIDQLRRMTPQLRSDLCNISGIPVTDILFLAADRTPDQRDRLAAEIES